MREVSAGEVAPPPEPYAVRVHLYAVWLDLYRVWLDPYAVRVHLYAVWVHPYAVWVHLYPVWFEPYAVWLDLYAARSFQSDWSAQAFNPSPCSGSGPAARASVVS